MGKKIPAEPQREDSVAPMQKYREANGIEKQLQLDARKEALQRWAESKASRSKKKIKPKS